MLGLVRVVPLVIFRLLRTHHHGLGRVERLFALLAAGHVDVGRYAGAEFVGAQQRFERAVDLRRQVVFDGLPVFEPRFGGLRAIAQSLRASAG